MKRHRVRQRFLWFMLCTDDRILHCRPRFGILKHHCTFCCTVLAVTAAAWGVVFVMNSPWICPASSWRKKWRNAKKQWDRRCKSFAGATKSYQWGYSWRMLKASVLLFFGSFVMRWPCQVQHDGRHVTALAEKTFVGCWDRPILAKDCTRVKPRRTWIVEINQGFIMFVT